jgi:hypothetical protein
MRIRIFSALPLLFGISFLAQAHEVTTVEVIGNDGTRSEVIVDLLPKSLPAQMSDEEVNEFARRVKNLGVFDSVQVQVEGASLKVNLRKKGTLTPMVGFSTGKSLQDSSVTAGLQEYDFGGEGTRAGGKISYAERGLNFSAWIDEHTYSPTRWAREYEIYRLSSGFRFDDSNNEWSRNRLGGFAEWVSPFYYGSHILHEFQLMSYYENYTNKDGPQPLKEAVYVGGLYEIIYDRYKWDDLTPDGYKLVLEFRPGVMTTGRFRGEARFKFQAAVPVWEHASVLFNGNAAAVNPGDVNHSLLVGSQQGVRGLQDSFFRTALLNYLNTELRHSFRIAPRTFLQPVFFVDAASFRSMNPSGDLQSWTNALSTGAGLRLVPTAYTNLLLRADAARLVFPTQGWAALFGITQYI